MVPDRWNADTAPRTAREAANRLVAEGKHVHFVAHGESVCLSRHCPVLYR